MTVLKTNHNAYDAHYHLAFPVKYRKSLLKKDLWGGEFWSDGFYMATVSERGDWKTVERYVANQGKARSTSSQLRLLT